MLVSSTVTLADRYQVSICAENEQHSTVLLLAIGGRPTTTGDDAGYECTAVCALQQLDVEPTAAVIRSAERRTAMDNGVIAGGVFRQLSTEPAVWTAATPASDDACLESTGLNEVGLQDKSAPISPATASNGFVATGVRRQYTT